MKAHARIDVCIDVVFALPNFGFSVPHYWHRLHPIKNWREPENAFRRTNNDTGKLSARELQPIKLRFLVNVKPVANVNVCYAANITTNNVTVCECAIIAKNYIKTCTIT